jgi:multiple sugar transport system permease protein
MATAAASSRSSAATRTRSRVTVGRVLFYIGVILIVLFCLAPLLWVFDESIKPTSELSSAPPTFIPSSISFQSYANAFTDHPTFAGNIKNSVIISVSATIIALVFGASAAYAIARLKFRGRVFFLSLFLLLNLFPQIALLGALYVFFYQIHWIDTYQGLIVPNVVFTLPLTVWILVTFFRELPRELEESAKVDGAGVIRTFFSVVLPLAAPGVFTTAILAFIAAWSDFFWAVSFTTKNDVQPVTVGLVNFSGGASFNIPWGEIAAGAIIVTVPLIVVVLILQRRIVAGLTAGAVKG